MRSTESPDYIKRWGDVGTTDCTAVVPADGPLGLAHRPLTGPIGLQRWGSDFLFIYPFGRIPSRSYQLDKKIKLLATGKDYGDSIRKGSKI